MQARAFPFSTASTVNDLELPAATPWGLLYAVEDFPAERLRTRLTKRYPGIEKAQARAPFFGVASCGEPGCFTDGRDTIDRHGNPMSSSVPFVRR